MVYVFDSSFIVAQIIPDEYNPRINTLYRKTKNSEKQVPQLFWYEVSNIFMNLIRRKRYTLGEVEKFYKPLTTIGLIVDFESGIAYSQKLLRLCNRYNLSSYDAAYLELAERKKAVLCTLDEDLRTAAKKHGVSVI